MRADGPKYSVVVVRSFLLRKAIEIAQGMEAAEGNSSLNELINIVMLMDYLIYHYQYSQPTLQKLVSSLAKFRLSQLQLIALSKPQDKTHFGSSDMVYATRMAYVHKHLLSTNLTTTDIRNCQLKNNVSNYYSANKVLIYCIWITGKSGLQ